METEDHQDQNQQNNNNNQKHSNQKYKKNPSEKRNNSKFFIHKSTEPGFENLETAFENKKQELGYKKEEDYYYDSYSHFNIHEEMLKDKVRTNAYKNAILKNKHLFKDKVVLDIGCGTGILSLFAAQAGAKLVIGVDNANIVDFTRKIVKQNGFEDQITIIKGKIEEVKLPVDKVDIIISEWMGYFLLYESMLDCVLWARDKYLKKDGLMFPDRAVIFLATIEDEEYFEGKVNFWENVYGFDMSCIRSWAQKEPLVEFIDAQNVNGEACAILDIDLYTVKKEDLDFTAEFKIKVTRDDYVHGYIAWFDTFFSHSHVPIKLSTTPYSKETHWKQTIFYNEGPLCVYEGDVVKGSIAVKKAKDNERNIDVKISTHLENRANKYDKVDYYKIN